MVLNRRARWEYILFLCLLTDFRTYGYEKNYTLYQITAFTHVDRYLLTLMQNSYKQVTFLNGVTNEAALPIYVAVDDCCLQTFLDYVKQFSISFVRSSHFEFTKETAEDSISNSFLSWYSMLSWFITMEKNYPNTLTRIVIGQTYMKNDLIVFKVSKHTNNPAVFILGGEEGRDWMSPAIILNLFRNILEDNSKDLTKYYDFYFLPLLNPDGYEYSRNEDRFWSSNQKELSPKIFCSQDTPALGVNIDRNWFHGVGAARECSTTYAGHKPLSEEESFTLSLFLDTIAPRIIAFFNLRGFNQLITTPYATNKKHSNNFDTIMEILNYACEGLKNKYNVTYFFGSTASLLFKFTGNCADWVKENLNVPVVATIYMKHGDDVVGNSTQINILYQQFETLIQDVLHPTKYLYGPLFNSQNGHSNRKGTLLILIVYVVF